MFWLFRYTLYHTKPTQASAVNRTFASQFITLEEYVSVCGFASFWFFSSQWRSACQRLYISANCTPFHTSTQHLGHTCHFAGKMNSALIRQRARTVRARMWRVFLNKRCFPCVHTPTHAVSHSVSNAQTGAQRNYHLHNVMMWLAI